MIEIITEADYKDRLAATQNGVLLFFKKLCPHCKNMEKVLEKFGAAKPGIALYGIDRPGLKEAPLHPADDFRHQGR